MIRKVTSAGMVTTYAGTGGVGSANGAAASATFSNPTHMTVDTSGNLYVSDAGLIRKISTSQIVSTYAGLHGEFTIVNGVVLDPNGILYVVEYQHSVIYKVMPNGTVSILAGAGVSGHSDATGTAASFNQPGGISIDAEGNLFLADTYNYMIRKIQ